MAENLADLDVVIVGFGPTGATLANLLGILGIKTAIMDREPGAYHLPRAVHFDDEIMRIFQNTGLSEAIEAKSRFNPGMRFIDGDNNLLMDWPRPTGISRQGWHTSYRFHQPDLENILRDGLNRFSHVTVLTGASVTQLDKQNNECQVHYVDRATGSREILKTKYVVGCDGAKSFVRDTMKSELNSFGFMERWLVVDVLLDREKPELGDYTLQYCVPSRPCTYVRGPLNRRRWEISVLEAEDAAEIVQPASVWKLLQPWLTPDEATLERAAVYTFESAVATKWKSGRVMIAGDASHLTPPFMGQGMCAGIRDVANLGWKLAQCCRGLKQDTLLDSYQIEREPHVTEYINTAMHLGNLINTSGDAKSLHSAFRQPDGSTKMKTIAPKLGRTQPLNSNRKTQQQYSLPCDNLVGTLSAQPLLCSTLKLDDKHRYTAILLCDHELWKESGLSPNELRWGANLESVQPNTAPGAYLTELGCRAIFIRADRYVLGCAQTTEDLRHLCIGNEDT